MSTPAIRRGASKRPLGEYPSLGVRRFLQLLFLVLVSMLVTKALIGERGLLDSLDARHENQRLDTVINELRQHNARLRDEVRRVREDPKAIENVAREELGMIKTGELLFLLRDNHQRR